MHNKFLFMAHIDMKNRHMNLNNGDNQQNIQINRSLIVTKQATKKSRQKIAKIKVNTNIIQVHNLFMLQCILGAMNEF